MQTRDRPTERTRTESQINFVRVRHVLLLVIVFLSVAFKAVKKHIGHGYHEIIALMENRGI